MTNLFDYVFMLYPLTERVAKALDDNPHINLEKMFIFVSQEAYKEQLALIDISVFFSTLRLFGLIEMSTRGGYADKVDDGTYSNDIVATCKRM